ncbi:hypothetical protein FH581_023210 (plasmid) [Leptospira weilii]|uniref:hypothetical protein n=1 Tax=Leptospira weilii TaxID=28184 RepID=UPI00201B754F|nr:hypothetical protein [Leptospira weilii]UPY81114.1 hypothetical protein FH581_022945 [Leptospira weilii]UPY81162.1 hypothetical protein FH581_023210 [Leptospira weilii]
MNQNLILQQIGQFRQIGSNKGKSNDEATSDAIRFVDGLLEKSNSVTKENAGSDADVIFHQMASQAFSLFHANDNQEEILETVSKSLTTIAQMSKKLSEKYGV